MDARFLTIFLIVIFSSFAQGTPLAALFGVKIGLALATVFFSAFFVRSFPSYFLLAGLSAAVIGIPSGALFEALVFFAVFLAGYLVRRAARWQPWLSYPISLVLGTIFLYALADIRFLAGHPAIVFCEAAYTAIFGLFLYLSVGLPHDLSRRHTF